MPIRFSKTVQSGTIYGNPFVGPINHTVAIPVPLAALTNKEIDADGYLKPGIPLTKAGALVTAGAVFGVTVEAVKVATDNANATIAALGTVWVAVVTTAVQVNQDIAEDNLGRVYTAAEIAGFAASTGLVLL
jgi:hypothetical protein